MSRQGKNRLEGLTEILGDIVTQAEERSLTRCPYKNKDGECTANFGCRNRRNKMVGDERRFSCAGDDKFDYRSAWESTSQGHKTLFNLADEQEREVPASCDRSGKCHECIVEIRDGMDALSPRTEEESFLHGNFRLACQAVVEHTDRQIDFIPLLRKPQILTQGRRRPVVLDPMVTRQGIDVLYEGVPVDEYRGHVYGLAIDIGTTTIAMDLVDLESGEIVQTCAFDNPQRIGGSDVMNRISYDAGNGGELWKALTNSINYEVRNLSETLNFDVSEIYDIVVVGNSTMRDILFQLDVQSIGQKPYKSVTEQEMLDGKRDSTSLTALSGQLGIKASDRARVWSPPLLASHVGADVAAGLGAVDFGDDERTIMYVDAGTNTEVVIRHRDRTIAASCPAGPAFEGGLVRFGMPGCDGAIDTIHYTGGSFDYTTIGGAAPQGLCGSGLIELLAELRRHDQMSPTGVFADRELQEITIVPEHDITFSREDASNLAQAKAANHCGLYILMRHLGLSTSDIDILYLAGAFANYVDIASAIDIGFLPGVPLDRIEKVGNAALQGAYELLLSRARRDKVASLVRNVEHIALESTPDFFDIFVDGCQMQPMPDPTIQYGNST
ncbi:MAG: ASKHA domain-containing protein [Woeseiaceae bacterium]